MEHAVCFNTLSFPALDRQSAYKLMLEACYGMLELNTGNDRFALYFDDRNKKIYECLLAEHYTYNDFLNDLETNQHIDLLYVLEEAEDKSPALEYLSSDEFDELASFQFYLPDAGFNEDMYILGIAWLIDGILLSLLTHERWGKTKTAIARWDDVENREDRYYINNISGIENGIEIFNTIKSLSELKLDNICPQCTFTEPFRAWFSELNENNQHRVYKKIQLAAQRYFSGGEPLFKTLESGDGIRELRFSAYPGGAIRILFAALPEDKKAILLGFIKKSDNEGYKENIDRAKSLLMNIFR
ncbi:Toxin-antitoxin system, toxin component, HigB-like [Desulfonema limicola]|uniref:Toxin-antitoxin system, toxin component, HigB-like n=1 Tax=Desulfonema limicola TaxID=45656 RepID=A0A975B976_9BACT|nr:type II toxin-antitoxin system RelE/ParE family toxin [Desulfonema limicola]QTA81068.1 Toxin-antitoxin system, toxin component, HigB-like [Desulfonema limicola]